MLGLYISPFCMRKMAPRISSTKASALPLNQTPSSSLDANHSEHYYENQFINVKHGNATSCG